MRLFNEFSSQQTLTLTFIFCTHVSLRRASFNVIVSKAADLLLEDLVKIKGMEGFLPFKEPCMKC